jgi:hypothetical protein
MFLKAATKLYIDQPTKVSEINLLCKESTPE